VSGWAKAPGICTVINQSSAAIICSR